ncbi:hypothetical protein V1478_000609, partial [Vespula squamosa]
KPTKSKSFYSDRFQEQAVRYDVQHRFARVPERSGTFLRGLDFDYHRQRQNGTHQSERKWTRRNNFLTPSAPPPRPIRHTPLRPPPLTPCPIVRPPPSNATTERASGILTPQRLTNLPNRFNVEMNLRNISGALCLRGLHSNSPQQKLWTADRPAAAAGVRLIHLGPSHMTGWGETYPAEVLT